MTLPEMIETLRSMSESLEIDVPSDAGYVEELQPIIEALEALQKPEVSDQEIIRGRLTITINETIHQQQAHYSEELVQKLEDLKYAYTTTYKQAVTDVLRHQVQVLEARMDTLRDLEEDLQKVLKEEK